MKENLKDLIHQAILKAYSAGHLSSAEIPPFDVEAPKAATHGDFATNAAMVMAKIQKMAPRQIAQLILDHLEDSNNLIASAEIAGPGFINFFITPAAWASMLKPVYSRDKKYGATNLGQGRYVQVEFVSANPTGPLHVGHGRGAAVGDSVANILAFCGWNVQREYYINDSGRQIRTLGRSVYYRYQELLGQVVDFPEDCYQGDYIRDLAEVMRQKHGAQLLAEPEENAVDAFARYAAQVILDGIRLDLDAFGIRFERWFSEQTLYDDALVEKMLVDLKTTGLVYEADGAWWFKSTDYGDEKDRVVVRQNGQTTYFASDIAYHHEKYSRGFDRVIDVWGADHHGYIPRVSAAIQAVGRKPQDFQVILVQLVNLLRQGQPVAMSTRAGEFETLKDVINEVGADAARFIFLSRHYESPLDFDLEVAKQQTNDNPVYYVQYVHARIASILRKAAASDVPAVAWDAADAQLLQESAEIDLIKTIGHYPEVVSLSARKCEPHRISHYLIKLAGLFHTYYNKHRVLTDDMAQVRARLLLIVAVQKVIRNGLTLLGVHAPERM